MALYLEQRFPLGRFHATRWKQGAFGDPYGEWPPSPWRLLRALANRWFQWSRETGDGDRDRLSALLGSLAASAPTFYLPTNAPRGPAIRQYLPMGLEWTDPKAGKPAAKRTQRVLNEDQFRTVPADEPIYWVWPDLQGVDVDLLDALLGRVLYFGRAEAWTRLRRVTSLPPDPGVPCGLGARRREGTVPVLAPDPAGSLDLESLLTTTEQVMERDVPPGTVWLYALLPEPVTPARLPLRHSRSRADAVCIQFAVGGRVFPPPERWVLVTDRFRGTVLRERFEQLTGKSRSAYQDLSPQDRELVSLLTGKDGDGVPLTDHRHAYFALIPDSDGLPSRLVVWRSAPFTEDEIAALLDAAEHPVYWDPGAPKWPLRLVPLPFETPPPRAFSALPSPVWQSLTPFVPPVARRRHRPGGVERWGERPERLAVKFLRTNGFPEPARVDTQDEEGHWRTWTREMLSTDRRSSWMLVHRRAVERRAARGQRTVGLGYYLRLYFEMPVSGPICVGDSAHFGLGLFEPVE